MASAFIETRIQNALWVPISGTRERMMVSLKIKEKYI